MSRLFLLFGGVFLIIYLIPLGERPIVTPDEARYGAIPAEMLATGEWVAPRLNGIRYYEKPVLGYWFTAISQAIFGANAWAIRLPSALGMGFSALCLVMFASRLRIRPEVGWLSAIALLTMLGTVIGGTVATLDAMFTGALTGAITFFYLAWTAPTRATKVGWLALFGGFCGLAFLIKGFLGLALPTIVIAPFLLWMRAWRDVLWLPWIPMAVAAVVIAPWAIAVHLADRDFWHYFFWVEHVQRFTGGAEAQHPEPFWFFFPRILIMALPWTLAGLLAVVGLGFRGLRDPWTKYLVCWLFLPLIFFSISSGKLPTYILPCLPAAAFLLVMGIVERFQRRPENPSWKWLYPGIILMVLGCLAFVEWGLGLVEPSPWPAGGSWRYGVIGAALFAWAALDLCAAATREASRRVLLMGLSPVLMFACVALLLPTNWMNTYKAPERFLRASGDVLEDPEALVITHVSLMHAVNWLFDRYDVVLFGDPGEVAWGIGDHADRQLDGEALLEIVTQESQKRPVVLLLRNLELLDRIQQQPGVPQPRQFSQDGGVGMMVFGPSP